MNNEINIDLSSQSSIRENLERIQEEQKKERLENNKLLKKFSDRKITSNKEEFQKEPKYHTCKRYNPCPICYKCMNKASHLYKSCQTCKIPFCNHTYADRKLMIRRKNFEISVTDEVEKELLQLAKEFGV